MDGDAGGAGMADAPIDIERAARYFAGDATPAERAAFEAWVAAQPGRAELVEGLRALWVAGPDLPAREGFDADAFARRVIRQVAHRNRRVLHPDVVHIGHVDWGVSRHAWVPAAAAIVVTVAAALVWQGRHASRAGVQPMREIATRPGSFATLTLRDGTQLTLGPGSHLRIPADYGRSTRAVVLDGEALFAVVHDATHPFEVRTATAITRDVGTRFSVRAYAADGATRVVVAEGSVDVATGPGRDTGGTRMLPGDAITIDARGHASLDHDVAVADEMAWSEGRIVLHGVPLRDAVRELARAYGIDVRVSDTALALRRVTLTADVARDRPSDVLTFLSLTLGARIEREGAAVTFVPGAQ